MRWKFSHIGQTAIYCGTSFRPSIYCAVIRYRVQDPSHTDPTRKICEQVRCHTDRSYPENMICCRSCRSYNKSGRNRFPQKKQSGRQGGLDMWEFFEGAWQRGSGFRSFMWRRYINKFLRVVSRKCRGPTKARDDKIIISVHTVMPATLTVSYG